MRVKNRYLILALVSLTLSVYYSAIFGGVNSVDDVHIIDVYGVNGHVTLKDILMPGKGFYFRPLVELSYYLDSRLWGLEKSFLHLENIILHTLNAVLVYLVSARVFRITGRKSASLPFLSAALFALHPVNTEAVSWIAGRTDPLAAFFVLSSTLFLMDYLENNRISAFLLSLAFLFTGLFAKESVIVFLPAVFFFLFARPNVVGEGRPDKCSNRKKILLVAVSTIVAVTLFLVWFSGKKAGDAMSMVLSTSGSKSVESLIVSLKALGFYVKKLFVPVPLNFAISSVEDYYLFPGISALCMLVICLWKRSVYSLFMLGAFLLICPALVVSMAGVSWTPVAERYLYIPSAFFAIGLVGYIAYFLERAKKESWIIPAMSLLIIPAGGIVMQRNEIWHDNLSLYTDTVKKSPDFAPARNELAVALIKEGKVEEGRAQLEFAHKMKPSNANSLIELNLLALKLRTLPVEQQRAELVLRVRDRKYTSLELLKMLSKLDESLLLGEKDANRRQIYAKEIIETNDRIYNEIRDPALLYRNGQLFLLMKDSGKASRYFRLAADNAPEGAYYKAAAEKLARELGKK